MVRKGTVPKVPSPHICRSCKLSTHTRERICGTCNSYLQDMVRERICAITTLHCAALFIQKMVREGICTVTTPLGLQQCATQVIQEMVGGRIIPSPQELEHRASQVDLEMATKETLPSNVLSSATVLKFDTPYPNL